MDYNWAEVSLQLEQELQSEQAQRQTHRRRQPRFHWPSLRWWTPARRAGNGASGVAQVGAQSELSPRRA